MQCRRRATAGGRSYSARRVVVGIKHHLYCFALAVEAVTGLLSFPSGRTASFASIGFAPIGTSSMLGESS